MAVHVDEVIERPGLLRLLVGLDLVEYRFELAADCRLEPAVSTVEFVRRAHGSPRHSRRPGDGDGSVGGDANVVAVIGKLEEESGVAVPSISGLDERVERLGIDRLEQRDVEVHRIDTFLGGDFLDDSSAGGNLLND